MDVVSAMQHPLLGGKRWGVGGGGYLSKVSNAVGEEGVVDAKEI